MEAHATVSQVTHRVRICEQACRAQNTARFTIVSEGPQNTSPLGSDEVFERIRSAASEALGEHFLGLSRSKSLRTSLILLVTGNLKAEQQSAWTALCKTIRHLAENTSARV